MWRNDIKVTAERFLLFLIISLLLLCVALHYSIYMLQISVLFT